MNNKSIACLLTIPHLLWASITIAEETQEDKKILDAMTITADQIGYYEEEASTALKQSVPLLETPQSVFVINDTLIADQQVFRMDQILQNDSSVQKANNFLGAYSSYTVRGFVLSNGSNYLRDGRPFFHLSAPPTELLEKVEVLKGPSSVLYGTLAPGGLINQISKKPPHETTGFLKATFGSYDLQHYHLDIGGPINQSGTVRYRINLVSENSESFRQFFNGDEFEVDREIYGLAFAWDITDQTTLTINHDNTEDDRPQDNGLIGDSDGLYAIQPYDLIYNQPWSHYNSEVSNTLVELDHHFNTDWGIKIGFSYQDYMRDRYDNQIRRFDPLTGDNIIRARRRLNERDYTTYFSDLTGAFNTGGIKHNVLLGFDVTKVDRHDHEIQNADRVTFVSNIFDPAYPNPNIVIGNREVNGKEDRKGFYLQDMLELGDQWRFLVGGRYDDFETNNYETSNFTPRVGLLYLLRDNLSFYSSYSESFEPNGPVGGGYANEGQELDPTVGEMFEIGAKWETFNGNLLVTGAAFIIERDGNPIENISTNIIEQRGLQKSKGIELTASGLIGENLSLIASATVLDAEIKRDDDISLIGNTPYGVADLSISLWAEYQLANQLLPGLSLQGGIFYESDRPVDDENSFDLDSYYRVDIGAKYAHVLQSGHGITTRLTVSNLFDEEYYKGRSYYSVSPERPREIRFSLEYNF